MGCVYLYLVEAQFVPIGRGVHSVLSESSSRSAWKMYMYKTIMSRLGVR